ncbi:hypothetical protein [Microvirga arabica]|uniref:hypothetical protein n=1 Tax=Microvirga arabica TaxID=1128671 RepID=UPI0019393FAC|nr:hypothetical protein [Microvirga arabica]MBM1169657.1 hypothetical protein [Microvirga arabica]
MISIHPAALKKVLTCATELREMMERGDMEGDHALSEAFRFFLHSVVVQKPDGWRKEPTVEIRSPWMAFNANPPTATASSLSGGLMVAEVRFTRSPYIQRPLFFLGSNDDTAQLEAGT